MLLPAVAEAWEDLLRWWDEFYNDPNFWLHLSLLVCVASITIYIYVHIIATRKRLFSHPWNTAPGRLPVVGHWHKIRNDKNLTAKLEQWADLYGKQHGCYDIQIFGSTYTVICRDDLADYILKNRVDSLVNAQQYRDSLASVGAGTALITAEGDAWREERQLVAPLLMKKHQVQDYMTTIQTTAKILIEKWVHQYDQLLAFKKKKAAKMDHHFLKITINNDITDGVADMITHIATGKSLDLLSHPKSRTAKDIRIITLGAIRRGLSLVHPYWHYLPSFLTGQSLRGPKNRLLHSIEQEVKEEQRVFVEKQGINGIGDPARESTSSSSKAKTFLQKLFRSAPAHSVELTTERATGEMLTLLLGGVQPLAKTLIRALCIIAEDQDLQRELREEADTVHLESLADPTDIYNSLPRLKSFFHEVHRWYGVGLQQFRIQEELPFCGTLLPCGSNLILLGRYLSTTAVSRSYSDSYQHSNNGKGYYSDTDGNHIPGQSSPSEFDPRRYLSKSDEPGSWVCKTPRHGTAFGGFGFGVRRCPGRHIAELYSYCVVTLLLQQFELELPTGKLTKTKKRHREIYDIVQALQGKITLKLTKREN